MDYTIVKDSFPEGLCIHYHPVLKRFVITSFEPVKCEGDFCYNIATFTHRSEFEGDHYANYTQKEEILQELLRKVPKSDSSEEHILYLTESADSEMELIASHNNLREVMNRSFD